MRNRPTNTTYRNRRIIALVVLALVVVIVWNVVAGIVGFVSGIFNPGEAKPAATASAPANSGVMADCAPGTVAVQANVGVDTTPTSVFPAKIKPSFSFTLTNTGTVACNFNAGTKVSFFTVTSGKEVIWDNKDCKTRATSDVDAVITLQPAVPQVSPASTWDRVYSSSKGCDATTEKAVAGGGASYHLIATVNGVKSPDVQFILN
ncbi:MAG: hypothetical protein ACKOUD_06055 [Rhodoluna sp.]